MNPFRQALTALAYCTLLLMVVAWLCKCMPQGPAFEMPDGRCAASQVAPGQALTAGHCAPRAPSRDTARDLALVNVDGATTTATTRAAIIGEPVWACRWGTCRTGMVLREGVGWYELSLTIAPGWSGSPVFAFDDGAQVATITACQGDEWWSGTRKEKRCKPAWAFAARVVP